ncbi:hypothetical protein ETD96_11705 [Actinomadura geliboluensis]|uniref:Uncharacterized protein n=1 Tax=Actinomadura geliboluensis TaxID=882440 RepID=A0A5S4HJV8_9ACTN|nr:hypothetical protein ETD96_11705 [Actinomadura geliboluensis]
MGVSGSHALGHADDFGFGSMLLVQDRDGGRWHHLRERAEQVDVHRRGLFGPDRGGDLLGDITSDATAELHDT